VRCQIVRIDAPVVAISKCRVIEARGNDVPVGVLRDSAVDRTRDPDKVMKARAPYDAFAVMNVVADGGPARMCRTQPGAGIASRRA
jgi:hypothetical protein